ncbi:hypothetical protein LPJ78_001646 [Coemansia sp. RSA 989]|nr:BET3 family protein [Coemansia mojavensis]KAJ1743318.1 hypothetical protein LPJ68_001112 [Coemansia sp. RSA 1086]KAJ1752966.1 hypothetical protein LPJ79_000788 [Coemansia sp. RSA 1821]KAJ1866695.1 hypothetical protein LPJ78_001646 [Coemansia sp. RSA 989]KAJ1875482.1 hypothetical protein LPJ55_000647 [Coemansia sp. RSA 990]KAJ2651918.1 hypothetical protein IWW40_001466 [Coemansia sp. RSA 1250]KAJ2674946.1 hypothetical protein IWW42_001448 [Coemansia sp. RSA 1085]
MDSSTTPMAQLMSALSLDGKLSTESRQINASAFEFLLPELVNTMVITTVETKRATERLALGLKHENVSKEQTTDVSQAEPTTGTTSGWLELPDDTELMEQVFVKLESVGFRVGTRLAERFAPVNRRLTDTLEIVKFICKDIWMLLFNRQIDNLKTNHRGIYVLQDNKFKWFLRMSGNNGGAAAARRAQPYIWLPCGIIRGILDSFGVSTVVVAETLGLPQCTFQIKVVSDD